MLLRLQSLYCAFLFFFVFLLLLPGFLWAIWTENYKLGYQLNFIWSKCFLFLGGLSLEKEFRAVYDQQQSYIIAPNHTSYLDIPTVGQTPVPFLFLGKSSLAKVPLFGYMYRKLHILVDRNSLKSNYETFKRSIEAVESGKSLIIFPEGGILSKHPPQMARFKDGPFRVAIEKQIPIIPVTIPFNWIILPDDNRFLLRGRCLKVIYHEPVPTVGLTLADLDQLKAQVYDIISDELVLQNKIIKEESTVTVRQKEKL